MENVYYRNKETGNVVDALSWEKEAYLELCEEWIRDGEMQEGETSPSDEEFIEAGVMDLDNNEGYERV